MKALKDLTRILPVEVSSMRREKSFIQKKRIAVMRDFMRVSILWIVLVITIRLRVFSMR